MANNFKADNNSMFRATAVMLILNHVKPQSQCVIGGEPYHLTLCVMTCFYMSSFSIMGL